MYIMPDMGNIRAMIGGERMHGMMAPKGFGLYRLHGGAYAGWRLRDVWRHDPNALLGATQAPTTRVRDAAAIKLFLMLLGGIMYRSPEERLLDEVYRTAEIHHDVAPETLVA